MRREHGERVTSKNKNSENLPWLVACKNEKKNKRRE
jgi:hypothetical protein